MLTLKYGENSAARELVRIRTRLLHVYKLSPCKRRSLGESAMMAFQGGVRCPTLYVTY